MTEWRMFPTQDGLIIAMASCQALQKAREDRISPIGNLHPKDLLALQLFKGNTSIVNYTYWRALGHLCPCGGSAGDGQVQVGGSANSGLPSGSP
jgi:hypothetical protein